MLHTFVAYVEDRPGVLTRVASLFRRLNINIHSLTVGHSEQAGLSRMTVVADASAEAGHRIQASLYKLENVVEVDDIAQAPSVTRELALIKVGATPGTRSQIFELVEVFRARIVDLAPESMIIEMTGVESKIDPGAERRRWTDPGDLPQRQADDAPRASHQRRADGDELRR
jgi:acetolactate synthase-1/3 small subunit